MMVDESEKDDFYWTSYASTSSFLDDENTRNNLWDGLFSPDDNSTKFFEPKNDFDKQISTNENGEIDNGYNINDNESTTVADSDSEISTDIKIQLHQKPPEFSPIKEQSSSSHQSQSSSINKLAAKFNTSAISTCTRDSSNSLDDSQTASDLTVHLDYARLKAEHRKLKKYFENAYENRYKTPPISETIRRISRCENVTLDFYRSKKEKMDLLDAALELDDWDVIITVVLFVKRTLDSIFRQCLLEKPAAAKHYINYLNESGDKQELLDTLYGLGRIADATMLEFEQACSLTDSKRKLDVLKRLQGGFHHPDLVNEKRHLEEWINLLETHTKPH